MDHDAADAIRQIEERLERQNALLERRIQGLEKAVARSDEGIALLADGLLKVTQGEHATYRIAIATAAIAAERAAAPLEFTDKLRQLALDVLDQEASETRERLEHSLTVIETYASKA